MSEITVISERLSVAPRLLGRLPFAAPNVNRLGKQVKFPICQAWFCLILGLQLFAPEALTNSLKDSEALKMHQDLSLVAQKTSFKRHVR